MRLLQRKLRCALLVLLPAFLFGQADKGTLLGTVADASQAVIPQTVIRVTEINTGVSRSVTSNAGGKLDYSATRSGNVPRGSRAPGF